MRLRICFKKALKDGTIAMDITCKSFRLVGEVIYITEDENDNREARYFPVRHVEVRNE